MTDNQRAKLAKIAAEMVRGNGMPLECVADMDLPKTTPVKAKRAISEMSSEAREQCGRWANVIRELIGAK